MVPDRSFNLWVRLRNPLWVCHVELQGENMSSKRKVSTMLDFEQLGSCCREDSQRFHIQSEGFLDI